MEKVQFQLEGTLPELKDLHEKGLFSRPEIQEITKRRTAFETALVRRQARKDDFFKYAEYEINLEKLRKIRWKKLSEYGISTRAKRARVCTSRPGCERNLVCAS